MTHDQKAFGLIGGWVLVGLLVPSLGCLVAGSSGFGADIVVAAGSLGIVAAYLATLIFLFRHLRALEHHIGLMASAYLTSAFCLILIFSSYACYFNLYQSPSAASYMPYLHEDVLDPLYYSVAVFTTLGANDFAPKGFAGKFLVSTEALLGVTHSVTFVSLLLVKLTRMEERAHAAQRR